MIVRLKHKEEGSACPIKYINELEFNNLKEKIIVVLKPSSCSLFIVTSRDKDQCDYVYTMTKIYSGMNNNLGCTVEYFHANDLLDNNEYEVYMLDRLSQLKDIPNIEYYM